MRYPPIEHHGVVGDLHTVALVAVDGTIDFLCYPRFDSPSLFASLLDADRGGSFALAPVLDGVRHKQIYLPDSNILLTRFLSEEGVVEISDFMPIEEVGGHAHNLVRRIKAVRGDARIRMRCDPRFDYGRAERRVERDGDDVVFASLGPDGIAVRLESDVELAIDDSGAAVAEFTLRAGEHAAFVLDDARVPARSCDERARWVQTSFKQTLNWWRAWIARCTYRGRWNETVRRSALALKLLFSVEHGSLVAAPTFGLPEGIGGVRNWDYRYTWIRDASFTLDALRRIGFTDETAAFVEWIKDRVVAEGSPLQVMYGLDGRRDLDEFVLEHFEGYAGSRPVRIGNGAYDQLQLDIFGELIDAIDQYLRVGGALSRGNWAAMVRIADWVCAHWRTPDQGIWETRGPPREYLHARVMCWVALARTIEIAIVRSLPAPIARWTATRDEIFADVDERFWNPDMRSYVHVPGTRLLDASCLTLPLYGFVDATDPRWVSTLRAVERELVEDTLVFRYRQDRGFDDGVGGPEGSFPLCTFWYVQCLARAGDVQQARFAFEKLLGYANHLGLFAEELGPTGEHLGNFPQALTHLALISAACDLDRLLDRAEG